MHRKRLVEGEITSEYKYYLLLKRRMLKNRIAKPFLKRPKRPLGGCIGLEATKTA